MADPVLFQHAANEASSVTSLTVNASSPVPWAPSAAGHLIAVQVVSYAGGTISVTDGTNTYDTAYNGAASPFWGSACFFLKNSPAGISAITVHISNSSFVSVRVTEWSGIDTVSPLDGFLPDLGCFGTTQLSPWAIPKTGAACLGKNYTNSQASVLLLGTAVSDTTNAATVISTDASWTKIDERNVAGFSNLDHRNDYKILSSVQTFSPGTPCYFGTVNHDSVVPTMAAFKAVVVPTPCTVFTTLSGPSTVLGSDTRSFWRARLRGFSGKVPKVIGTSIIAEPQKDFLPDVNGLASGALWPNSLLDPPGTFYTIELFDSQGQATSRMNVIIDCSGGGSIDLSTVTLCTTCR